MKAMQARLEQACRGIAELTGCKVTQRTIIEVPPCVNAPAQAALAAEACEAVLGVDNVARQMKPLPFTDDLAHMLDAIPGAYLFLGQKSEMCHHPAYDFDDKLLPVAGSIFLAIVDKRLGLSCAALPVAA
jgi:metal-dependent amidase/aminoacylase/carboxypeptidase family protein